MRHPVLAYHDIADRPDESGFAGPGAALYKLPWDAFDAHLDALAAAAGAPSRAGEPPGRWTLTFDDGGACTLSLAESLARRGWQATFFVPTSRIGTPGFATADEVVETEALGHVIGSHSHAHPVRMSSLDEATLVADWQTSVDILSELLGHPVTVGSVPGGYTSRRVERAAARAGLLELHTSTPTTRVRRSSGCAVVGRFDIRCGASASSAAALTNGSGFARQKLLAGWALRGVPRRLLGDYYPAVRRAILARRSTAACLAVTAASAAHRFADGTAPPV
jgi:peptidoglycan/xylan/chitin deacetylase (PgdA/CDA1 family)